MRLNNDQLVCLQGCRSYVQYHRMRKDFESDICTFCQIDRTLNQIEWEDEHCLGWFVPQQFLREELAAHMIVVPKRHLRFVRELNDTEVLHIHSALAQLHKQAGYTGGMTFVREGDMGLNAGTVPHLHYNTFMPKETCEGEIRIPIMKTLGSRLENKSRAAAFAARYDAGELPE